LRTAAKREVRSVSKSDDYAGMSGGEDDIIYWQDAIEAHLAKRPDKMPKCAFCEVGVIKVTRDGRKTRLECQNQSCRHFVEGRFDQDADNFEEDFVSSDVKSVKKT
jgi:hypothetical protein